MKKKIKLLSSLLLLNFTFSFAQLNIYVSPNGSPGNNGLTINTPVKTIQQAKDIVRNNISPTMANDIIVNILGGTYTLDQPLVFDANDSGRNGKKIIYKAYQNQIPYISSAKVYNSNQWTLSDPAKNIWEISIGSLYSRQLYTNVKKLKRARSEINYGLMESTKGYFSFCNTNSYSNWNSGPKPARDLEVVSNNEWKSNRVPIQSICGPQLIVHDTIWKKNDGGHLKCKGELWLENAYQLLDMPDEWYIDRPGNNNPNILYLKTHDNNPPANVIIPQLETLISGSGVDNIVFDGLVFQYTNWNEPSEFVSDISSNKGLCIVQADWFYNVVSNTAAPQGKIISAAVKFYGSNNITFKNNTFEHIGSIGLQFLQNCTNNLICNNTFKDICASAISIGNPEHLGAESNIIKNNLIDSIATEYKGSIGIFVALAKKTQITNNEIRNFPYSGISVGYNWTSDPTKNLDKNIISYNKIDCSNQSQSMNDTGAIYTLGMQGTDATGERTIISNNYIINYRKRYGAIYLDQGSTNIEIENNVIELENTSPFTDNYVNWIIPTYYDAHNIYGNNNYFSSQYPFNPLNPPPFDPNYPSLPSSNIYISTTTNTVISSANASSVTAIKNASGIQSSTCP
ncbi:MAG: right-handed parallel beta-helix repeat-containing protein [Flavobacterium lindanitolerans]|uniref:right-handed parallel beta-helix repeat-containing protein n=1 Tax=Flavobacterium lindanitolerans TaxID=428988 RepID=UPI001A413C1F|nr:right-handed parallel beta-helix repeat-containing protein [Flavobacterium lindanitolerans]MBL7867906.1 right-handed parallel beta-helix repeat-containing protein [Flavobacterium lindanitolerans]